MITVCSYFNNPSDLTSQTFMINNADVDFIDIINQQPQEHNQKPRKTRPAKFPCYVCGRNFEIN